MPSRDLKLGNILIFYPSNLLIARRRKVWTLVHFIYLVLKVIVGCFHEMQSTKGYVNKTLECSKSLVNGIQPNWIDEGKSHIYV